MANKTITQLDTAQSLNDNMVIAVQDTNTTYKTTLADVKAYCGAAPAGDKYKVGDRVNDDSNNPVGTVSSIFTDGNGDRYAVVCLDAINRSWGLQYSSTSSQINNIPNYSNSTNMWSAPETATTNTTAILGQLSSNACSHCRSKSFVIGGNTYYGQFPNLNEMVQIFIMKNIINANDPTVSTYSNLKIPSIYSEFTDSGIWCSTQGTYNKAWYMISDGTLNPNTTKASVGFVIPVLEIPLED